MGRVIKTRLVHMSIKSHARWGGSHSMLREKVGQKVNNTRIIAEVDAEIPHTTGIVIVKRMLCGENESRRAIFAFQFDQGYMGFFRSASALVEFY